MPECDGLTAARAIRKGSGPNARSPIVAFTANVSEDDRAGVAAAGMDGMISKPCSMATLKETVDKWMSV